MIKLIKLLYCYRAFCVIFLLGLSVNSFAQKGVTAKLVFRYPKGFDTNDSAWFDIGTPLMKNRLEPAMNFPKKRMSSRITGDTCETTYQYTIKETTCAYIGDLFGHEIVMMPGDSIAVTIGEQNRAKLAGKFMKPWLRDLSYSGKNRYIYSFFDSLSAVEGELSWGSTIAVPRNTLTLDSFCNAVKVRYTHRLEFVQGYAAKYAIPVPVLKLVKTEIFAAYLINLNAPLDNGHFTLAAYPAEFSALIQNKQFDDEGLYFNTRQYAQLVEKLAYLESKPKIGEPYFSQKRLLYSYDWIKKNDTGKIRDHQLATHIWQFLDQYHTFSGSIDSLFLDFKKYSGNKGYVNRLDSSIRLARNKPAVHFSLEQALASEIADTSGHQKTIHSLFHHKPVLIICWASWCVPCLAQMPYENKLEKEYGDKIDFVYLSFDRSVPPWKAKANELHLHTNNYFLLNGFKAGMAQYYNVSSIPQYFVYNTKGKLVENKSFRPSDKQFAALLDESLK